MERDFWLGRWERGETGWHQTEVEPGLIAHFSHLKPTSVLVPLCGKSLDLRWLAERGHEVLGIELSEKAVREFFKEQGLAVTESRAGSFLKLKSGRITLLQGDFFELTPAILRSLPFLIGAAYDRAALIALPPDLRVRYTAHLQKLVKDCGLPTFEQLQIVLERTPVDSKGPPFSVSESEVRDLYSGSHEIQALGRETLESPAEGVHLEECLFRITPRKP